MFLRVGMVLGVSFAYGFEFVPAGECDLPGEAASNDPSLLGGGRVELHRLL